MNQIQPPNLVQTREQNNYYKYVGTVLEFLTILKANKQIKLRTFRDGYSILEVKLKEAKATIRVTTRLSRDLRWVTMW